MEIGHPSSILWCQRFFLLILFSIKKIFFREAIKKLRILWHRHKRTSFTEEIVTYIQGGRVSDTDVIILYIHTSLLNLAFITENCENSTHDYMELELKMRMCFLCRWFYAENEALESKSNMTYVLIFGGWVGRLNLTKMS